MSKQRKEHLGVGEGWRKLVEPLIDLCKAEGVEILQIKEKFGGLRFYVGSAGQNVYDAIDAAEAASFSVCEECGAPGKPVDTSGWTKTACETHSAGSEPASERITLRAPGLKLTIPKDLLP